MHDLALRDRARRLLSSGLSVNETSRRIGVSPATVRRWRDRPGDDSTMTGTCPRCAASPRLPSPPEAYAYLLGLYLGDGCISWVGDRAKQVWALRIACADTWPGLVQECVDALRAVRPTNRVRVLQKQGCKDVNSYSKHWPHLFPQHGPGKKHEREIVLAPWQREIVSAHPGRLVRGLMHSDGYRGVNRVRRDLPSGVHWYEYPRYLFKNESSDILALCGEALDLLGVAWRFNKRNELSVARREAVELLDRHVGPKY
ncbi:helix-turn-helix domain-containing protein [Nonomuraea fuscirosea]|uniref:helix-turn-helix domain-containing protein n=1 Tax=Nonomuraea fuscirosea TaxID=1291556 RepID=UPI002DD9C20A|nr:helix-turn-helix domain-containing protein [Nonomuraea fuscirosea]WSA47893.1 helix-turn-helix domain-containing protein [Nonomuraea fuscirosea]